MISFFKHHDKKRNNSELCARGTSGNVSPSYCLPAGGGTKDGPFDDEIFSKNE